MTTKHTPGPWDYSAGSHQIGIWSEQGDGGDIAIVYNRGECSDADARLIAAAPELLEACKAFLRAPSIGSSGPDSITIEVQSFNLDAARAAIAKAEGDTQ